MSEANVDLTFHGTVEDAQRILAEIAKLRGPARIGFIIFKNGDNVVSDTITVKDNDPPVDARASFADAEGVTVDVTATWTTDTPDVAQITTDPDDDQHVTITPGTVGAALVTCVGSNADGTQVTLVGTFTVVPGDAVVGAIDFQPGAAPGDTGTTGG